MQHPHFEIEGSINEYEQEYYIKILKIPLQHNCDEINELSY